jgi:Putative restriction endonuclease
VEIAHTGLSFDLKVKAALYARAGVPEYWVIDVAGRRLLVHRNPQEGKYADVAAYSEHESVSWLRRTNSSAWRMRFRRLPSSGEEPPRSQASGSPEHRWRCIDSSFAVAVGKFTGSRGVRG